MMKFLRLFAWIPAACAYVCVASALAQAIGIGILSSQGVLTPAKVSRYVAVVYGFDVRDLQRDPNRQKNADAEDLPREVRLEQRVTANPVLADRLKAGKQETNDIEGLVRDLKTGRTRYDFVKKSFGELLDQLESGAATVALQEVQRTLVILQPKQAKDLILRMLQEEGLDEDDDVLQDVVTIVKSMPQERLKKILGEFKTDEERQTLHRIFVEIGDLESGEFGETSS
jgi:hypothetical protein